MRVLAGGVQREIGLCVWREREINSTGRSCRDSRPGWNGTRPATGPGCARDEWEGRAGGPDRRLAAFEGVSAAVRGRNRASDREGEGERGTERERERESEKGRERERSDRNLCHG